MIIRNKAQRLIVGNDINKNKSITLGYGCTEIPDKEWELFRNSFEFLLSDGTLEEVFPGFVTEEIMPGGSKKKGQKKVTVKSKPLKDIGRGEEESMERQQKERVIDETFDVATLMKWKNEEPTDAFRAQIAKQIDMLSDTKNKPKRKVK